MNPSSQSQEEFTPTPTPNPQELPVQQPNEFEDVPLPRKVTRETDAGALHDKEDLRHGDEGIDDPLPSTEEA